MKMEKINNLLPKRFRLMGLENQVYAASVCEAADQIADGQFKAISFKRGYLKVRVRSNAVAHLTRLNEKALLRKINTKLKSDVVQKLGFVVEIDD